MVWPEKMLSEIAAKYPDFKWHARKEMDHRFCVGLAIETPDGKFDAIIFRSSDEGEEPVWRAVELLVAAAARYRRLNA